MAPQFPELASAASSSNMTTGLTFAPCPQVNQLIAASVVAGLPTFDCASLTVPLDYTNDASGTVDLSLFKVNATQQPSLGSVLMNFGGPGGTGAENLPAFAKQAHDIVGPQWDLVSWDPRGTGYTLPFQCNLSAAFPFPVSNTKRDTEHLVSTNVTEAFQNFGWELAGQVADACYEQSNETGSLIGTAFTARDMMQIVDAFGEDGLLRYYGWSYGTALGSYVAAMFPDRVERMVLDANINPHDYQSGTYGDMAIEGDAAFKGFLDTCIQAGDACAINNVLKPNSTAELFNTVNALLSPLAPLASQNASSYLIWAGLKGQLISDLYFPATWPKRAKTLADLISAVLGGQLPPVPSSKNVTYGTADTQSNVIGIRASDAIFHANSSEEYLPIVQQQASVSPGFSDVAYYSLWPSARWRMPAAERYWGDFNVTTKTPILYVNGQYDPVTPLVNAYNASQSFQGSSVLQHSGYGHGLLASPSECAARHVRAYFLNGTLPANATECSPDQTLLQTWLSNPVAGNASANGTTGPSSPTTSPPASSNDGTTGPSSPTTSPPASSNDGTTGPSSPTTPPTASSNDGSLRTDPSGAVIIGAAFAAFAFLM